MQGGWWTGRSRICNDLGETMTLPQWVGRYGRALAAWDGRRVMAREITPDPIGDPFPLRKIIAFSYQNGKSRFTYKTAR
jgi:hypothetical protein